jgi:hypothetical protein
VWVNCGDNIYVLDCLWKGYIRVEPAGKSSDSVLLILLLTIHNTRRDRQRKRQE